MNTKRQKTLGALLLLGFVVAACGSGGEKSAGPALPDLAPAPPVDIHLGLEENGDWTLFFTSVLVNVGDVDFLLEGTRTGGEWAVAQELPTSGGEVQLVPTDATMDWGGDGHGHWHVSRVASYRLVRLTEEGVPDPEDEGRPDTKVGFCFYDSGRELDRIGPDEPIFHIEDCGHEDDTEFRMGLSPGWGDTYVWALPGQSISISDLPDGLYRLWAVADERGWFQEVTRDNNTTWVNLELKTLEDDIRAALITAVGPEPGQADSP